MPKIDGIHIEGRLRERIKQLREGQEVAARDLRALLTDEQEAAMDAAWGEQQALRKEKRARTKEEEVALGWKTKREVYIETLQSAIADAVKGLLVTIEKRQRKAELRQAIIFMDGYTKATDEGKTDEEARTIANNDLTRARLNRLDGRSVRFQSKRDKEVWEMENQIRGRIRSQMTAEEREQIELAEAYEKALRDKKKILGR